MTSPDEILNEELRYYKRLYTSSRTNPNDPRFDVFYDSSTLPKLSPNQADGCDGLLTKKECYVSLKSFSKSKSPGTDGLTAEFYLSLWELLGHKLVDSFNYAFEKGEMSISQKRGIITLIPKKSKNRTLLGNLELERGVRQGCPLSGVLFVTAVEMLAKSIRNDKLITGINFKGREYKLSQYADDTSCLVHDEKSVEKLFERLEAFRECCGLDLNR